MSWAETKHAVNDSLGTPQFQPLNAIISGDFLMPSEQPYASAIIDPITSNASEKEIAVQLGATGRTDIYVTVTGGSVTAKLVVDGFTKNIGTFTESNDIIRDVDIYSKSAQVVFTVAVGATVEEIWFAATPMKKSTTRIGKIEIGDVTYNDYFDNRGISAVVNSHDVSCAFYSEIGGIPVKSINGYNRRITGIDLFPSRVATVKGFTKLTVDNLRLPDSVTTIEADCFNGATISSLEIGKNIQYIGESALRISSLTSLKINKTIAEVSAMENISVWGALTDIICTDGIIPAYEE